MVVVSYTGRRSGHTFSIPGARRRDGHVTAFLLATHLATTMRRRALPEPGYLVAAVLVSAAITWNLRAVPFALLAPLRSSRAVAHLGEAMPLGVMLILVGYTLRNARSPRRRTRPHPHRPGRDRRTPPVAPHVARSIVGGTVLNVVLASTVFAG